MLFRSERIRGCYREVLRHDRVGRLVDFQEFEHLEFPRERFSDDLLDELLRETARTVSLQGERVVVSHLYVGRRVRPLDLFLQEATAEEAESAVIDWGFALTVHKSQGSEWDSVLLCDDGFGAGETRRRWLYTAITRARSRLTILE